MPFCDACMHASSQPNEEHPNEDQQRLPQALGCDSGGLLGEK